MIYATLLFPADYNAALILNEEIRRHDPDARHYVLWDRRGGQLRADDRNAAFTRIDQGQTNWGNRLDTKDVCLEEHRWFLKLSAENGSQPIIKIDADIWINNWPRLRRVYADIAAGAATLMTGEEPGRASAAGAAYIVKPCDEIITALQSMTLRRYPEDKCAFAACATAGKKAVLKYDWFDSHWLNRATGKNGEGIFAHAGEPTPRQVNVQRETVLERILYSRYIRDLQADLAEARKALKQQQITQNADTTEENNLRDNRQSGVEKV